MMTLTMTSEETTVRDLYVCWDRLRAALRRVSKKNPLPRLREYALVVEAQARGALHIHVLCTGEYVEQTELCELALNAGFGKISDIRCIHDPRGQAKRERKTSPEDAAWYLAKYLSKSQGAGASGDRWEALVARSARRVRPVRVSRGWGCSMGKARTLIVEERRASQQKEGHATPETSGPWVVLVARDDGFFDIFGPGGALSTDDLLRLRADAPYREMDELMATHGLVPMRAEPWWMVQSRFASRGTHRSPNSMARSSLARRPRSRGRPTRSHDQNDRLFDVSGLHRRNRAWML
jgi:hypothetical protein